MITVQQYNDAKKLINDYFLQEYDPKKHNDILKIEDHRVVKKYFNVWKDSIYLSILKHEIAKNFDFLIITAETRSAEQGYNYEDEFKNDKFHLHLNVCVNFGEKSASYANYSIEQFFFKSENPDVISKWDHSDRHSLLETKFGSIELFQIYITKTFIPNLIKTVYAMWKNNAESMPISKAWFKQHNLDMTKIDVRKIEKDISKIVKKIVSEHFNIENFEKSSCKKDHVEYSFDINERGDALWRNSYIHINDSGIISISMHERYEGGDYENEIGKEINEKIKKFFK